MSVIVYKCSDCKREIEIPQIKHGLETFGRCIITSNCKGTLAKLSVKTEYIRGKLPPPDPSGLQDWKPRRLYFCHHQRTPSKNWVVRHNLGTNPSVEIVTSLVDGTYVHVPFQVEFTSAFELSVRFNSPFQGTAMCIVRSAVVDVADSVVSNTIKETNYVNVTGSGILTIATLDPSNSFDLNMVVLSPITLEPINSVAVRASNEPSYISAWRGTPRIFIGGKTYKVRTVAIPDIFKVPSSENAAPFYFTSDSKGKVFVLLSNEPYADIDVDLSTVIDIYNINKANTLFNAAYLNRTNLNISTSLAQTIYPPIKLLK